MAALVTGLGYIGAPLARRLVDERHTPVVAIDNFFSTPREAVANVQEGVRLLEGDVAEPADVARLFDAADEPSVLFHLAAQPSAAMASRDPLTTERSNLSGARVVLEAATERKVPVVFGGSFRVYGDELDGQKVDECTPYGRVGDLSHLSKVYVEQLARMLGLPFASVRLGVTYGLGPIMKTTPAFMTVPNLFCERAACGETLQVLEDRPMAFIHVDDAVSALLLAADRVQNGHGFEAYNAAPEVMTIGQLARTVQRLAQARGRWVRLHGAASSERGFLSTSRLDGFVPRQSLEGGLGDVLDYFVARA